jgi:integrase
MQSLHRDVPPPMVRASDVEGWAEFLRAGGRTLPPGLPEDARAALDAVTRHGSATAWTAAPYLARFAAGKAKPAHLYAEDVLGALARRKIIVSDPPQHGTVRAASAAPLVYRLPPPHPAPSPATLSQRLYALQSFFLALIGDGGKRAGFSGDGPFSAVPVSPVTPALGRVNRAVLAERAARSDARKTRRHDWEDLKKACWTRGVPEAQAQRDWTLLVCLATMGLRVGELCQVRMRDVEPEGDKRFVTVRRKGGARDRVLVPQVAWTEIERLHGHGTGPNLPLAALAVHRWGNQAAIPPTTPISTSQVQEIFRDLADVVAADTGRPAAQVHARLHPHGLRHLYAQALADAGVPLYEIRNLLGHKNIATTDTYLTRAAGKETDHTSVFAAFANRT